MNKMYELIKESTNIGRWCDTNKPTELGLDIEAPNYTIVSIHLNDTDFYIIKNLIRRYVLGKVRSTLKEFDINSVLSECWEESQVMDKPSIEQFLENMEKDDEYFKVIIQSINMELD